uniref:AlNc14C369G11081 protein n=1 Tax=Albugo laibachii Nc14 TaxID=890382 RepID=F0WY35_9STRA|nr:AlNc14C369G11081 [Albugo laibachii Nc14]|eukprot:CCA26384.1 AlNc14C369G11081 [Albugo laibachii Nc14]
MRRVDHNAEVVELSRHQKHIRTLIASSNDPVDLLLDRSLRQTLIRQIRRKFKEPERLRVIQRRNDLEKHKYTEKMYLIAKRSSHESGRECFYVIGMDTSSLTPKKQPRPSRSSFSPVA